MWLGHEEEGGERVAHPEGVKEAADDEMGLLRG